MKCVNHIVSNMLFKFAHKIYRSNDVEVYMLTANILEMNYSYSYNDCFISKNFMLYLDCRNSKEIWDLCDFG